MKSPDGAPPRVLIADDQSDVLVSLRLLLKSEGYRIETASSPAGVLEVLDSEDFDVLLVDLNYARRLARAVSWKRRTVPCGTKARRTWCPHRRPCSRSSRSSPGSDPPTPMCSSPVRTAAGSRWWPRRFTSRRPDPAVPWSPSTREDCRKGSSRASCSAT